MSENPKPRREAPIGSDSLFRSERIILEMYDAQMGVDAIVARTEYSRQHVQHVIRTLGGHPDTKMETMVQTGTIALLAAIQATGKTHACQV